MSKRYYWLKLKKDFFQQPEMAVLEEEEEGREILLLYLKLLLMGLEKGGRLRLNEKKPYTEKTLAILLKTSPETVRKTMEFLMEYDLLVQEPDGTLYLPGLSEMVGSETDKAEQMRKSRAKKAETGNNVTEALPDCYPEKEINTEREKESDPDLEEDQENTDFDKTRTDMTEFYSVDYWGKMKKEEQVDLMKRLGLVQLHFYLDKIEQFTCLKRKVVKDPYHLILKWYEEDGAVKGFQS